ncbi:hypothetical protein AAFF_G00352440 [Aldrovandia affinis]|uniref:Trichohyalin-plectin-homology domain-containing protein n=1 Tax=Aldrovandia affinis TaxID=143900 RepID=A0AAD7SIX0_9TELE|nr:hypothetical protein AAFF_G00352440 [Aldrovandia affinis]
MASTSTSRVIDNATRQVQNAWKEQIQRNLRIKNAAKEEARKYRDELRRIDVADLEKERQVVRQRQVVKRAYGEELRQQMKEMEQRRVQTKLCAEKEIKESRKVEKEYERQQLKQKQQQKAIDEQERRSRARHNALGKKEEKDRREMERQRQRQRERQCERKCERLGEKLATQESEKTRTCEVKNARTIATQTVAEQDAKIDYTQDYKKLIHSEMQRIIATRKGDKYWQQQRILLR